MKTITLLHGEKAIIDESSYDSLKNYRWYANNFGYAVRQYRTTEKQHFILMHRQIMGAKKGQELDHINGNRLDNRKNNLRFVSHTQNCYNRAKKKTASSSYKGVWWNKATNSWRAAIGYKYKSIQIGMFKNENEAARAYNSKSIELFGQYTRLNKIKEDLF